MKLRLTLLFRLIVVLLFLGYSLWFGYLYFLASEGSASFDYFTDSYGVLAGFGGFCGLYIASKWGGMKSLVGRGVLFLSLGLLFQFLGQLSYSLEFYLYGIENSYPSFGEIFYFGSIPLYILGVLNISKAAGSKFSLKYPAQKFMVVLVPLLLLGFSYTMFLRGYSFEDSTPLLVFLDFGYPLGQALYVSLTVITYFLTKKFLGGIMRFYVLSVLFSLVFQYLADSTFLYQVLNDTWYAGSFSDYLFLISYFLMSLALIGFLSASDKAQK